ncbi:MAG: hypothetical protein COB45_04320 [Gammaproteobacteria bacterium]|nr:MAG: hypothetical protein COB45_04320 [Gammaproteobacteria bacterium]
MTTKIETNEAEEKQKVIRAYFSEIKIMRAAYDNPELEWATLLDKSNAKRKTELKIAERYLTEYPILNDDNCSGRGLPAFTVKHLKEYLLFPVEELKKDELKIKSPLDDSEIILTNNSSGGFNLTSGMLSVSIYTVIFNDKYRYVQLYKNKEFVGCINSLMGEYEKTKAFIEQCVTSDRACK